ncbi:hypothetical protein C8Q75DRAFT_804508 [Abortiporus biennis]|nr:hypothetical protein C8Q75DRAFT_804508 [Abortiporus biennis]
MVEDLLLFPGLAIEDMDYTTLAASNDQFSVFDEVSVLDTEELEPFRTASRNAPSISFFTTQSAGLSPKSNSPSSSSLGDTPPGSGRSEGSESERSDSDGYEDGSTVSDHAESPLPVLTLSPPSSPTFYPHFTSVPPSIFDPSALNPRLRFTSFTAPILATSSTQPPTLNSSSFLQTFLQDRQIGLIQAPRGKSGYPNRGGYNLRAALNWPDSEYETLLDLVGALVRDYLDEKLCWSKQQPNRQEEALKEGIMVIPSLARYADKWPLLQALRACLKYTSQQHRLKEVVNARIILMLETKKKESGHCTHSKKRGLEEEDDDHDELDGDSDPEIPVPPEKKRKLDPQLHILKK